MEALIEDEEAEIEAEGGVEEAAEEGVEIEGGLGEAEVAVTGMWLPWSQPEDLQSSVFTQC